MSGASDRDGAATAVPLLVGDRRISNTVDSVRRYAGLPWSGGSPEVWAWSFYDGVPADHDDTATPVDVLCAAALHPGLSRSDLAYFVERAGDVSSWLAGVDPEERLWHADEALLRLLDSLVDLADGVSITLLSKVLHRKRPNAVPLVDRHIVDRYRLITGERRPAAAWPGLLRAIRDDLAAPENQLLITTAANQIKDEAAARTGAQAQLSLLRWLDIAVWMEAQG